MEVHESLQFGEDALQPNIPTAPGLSGPLSEQAPVLIPLKGLMAATLAMAVVVGSTGFAPKICPSPNPLLGL